MIGSGCSGFGRGNPPTDPKASGFEGGHPPPTIEVSVQAIFGSGSGEFLGLVGNTSWGTILKTIIGKYIKLWFSFLFFFT